MKPAQLHPRGEQPLQPLIQFEPLRLVSLDTLREALIDGGMHAPLSSSRSYTSALQWREGVNVEELFEAARFSISGAQALASLLSGGDHGGEAQQAGRGLEMLLGTAGGALMLLFHALGELEGRPRVRQQEGGAA